jgi:hypothetical protein
MLLIGTFIGTDLVPLKGVPYPDSVDPPSMEEMIEFFDSHHQAQDRALQSIRIGVFSSFHRLLAKIVQHNLWLIARWSDLVPKRVRFLYALIQWVPFCLCKHIVLTMLEMRDEHQKCLLFACLVTKICMRFVPEITDLKPKEKTKDTLGKHTVMKYNAQLRFEDQREAESPSPAFPVQPDPTAASSSQTTPPPPSFDVAFSQIMDALSSLQREVSTISVRVEQCQIDIKQCLKHFEPQNDDADDD